MKREQEECNLKVDLPAPFVHKMKALLGEEFEAFMASYDAPRAFGLRINPLKLSIEAWKELIFLKEGDKPIPWTKDGFYYSEEDRPGKHPYYHAGMYYIQEPSAMLPAELLGVRPGHRVLDLCAAPGGKTTQLAGKLAGSGVLVTNDNAAERTKALAKNVELAGVRNAVILNEEPATLAKVFPEWFDRILVDAPCSGEGMFRKDDSMIQHWDRHSVEKCSGMQRDILRHAAAMLAPGGLLLYSTCTFSPEENESQIAAFLAEHEDFAVEPIALSGGLSAARPDWIDEATASAAGSDIVDSLAGAVRLWPHLVKGEGHFAALLRKRGDASSTLRKTTVAAAATLPSESPRLQPVKSKPKNRKADRGGSGKAAAVTAEISPKEVWEGFIVEQLSKQARNELEQRILIAFGERVYLQSPGVPPLDGLRVVRAGWLAGEVKRNRFVPSQALAMGLKAKDAVRSIELDSEETNRYLRGDTLFFPEERIAIDPEAHAKPKGYVLVCLDGRPLGWGKYDGGMLKNELSPGWRRV